MQEKDIKGPKFKKEHHMITWYELKYIWKIYTPKGNSYLKSLEKPTKNRYAFISGNKSSINDIIKNEFFTLFDIANMLGLKLTEVRKIINDNNFKGTGTVKLWHIIDDTCNHSVPLKSNEQHTNKISYNLIIGKNKPETVVSRNFLINIICTRNKIPFSLIVRMPPQNFSKILHKEAKKGHKFISGSKAAIYDAIHHDFYTAANIANDLDISYKRVKKDLNDSYKDNIHPKIKNVIKLWHVVDDSYYGHLAYIKNKTQRILSNQKYKSTKGHMIGKNEPEPVVGVFGYLDFRQKYTIHRNELFLSDLQFDIMRRNKSKAHRNYYDKIINNIIKTSRTSKGYSFISGSQNAINDVIDNGFLTMSDIAVDLSISYTKAKRMLSPKKNKLKNTPKINSKDTVKLWHVIDDDDIHYAYIKNPQKRINGKEYRIINKNNNYLFGKNVPKRVVGLYTYYSFIRDFYDPSHIKRDHLKQSLSKFAIKTLRDSGNFNNLKNKLFYINTLERLMTYRSYIYDVLQKDDPKIFRKITAGVAFLYCDAKKIPPFDFNKHANAIAFAKPGYPTYKSNSRFVNQEMEGNYYTRRKEAQKYGKQNLQDYLTESASYKAYKWIKGDLKPPEI